MPTPEGSLTNEGDIPIREMKRSDAALHRLNVTRQQLALAPKISPMLKCAEGGMKHVISAMRLSPDEVIVAFLMKYDSIPEKDRISVPIEAIAIAANVNLNELLGSTMQALQTAAVSMTKILAVTWHPKITQARIANGLLPLGERDRTALDTAVGFLPSAKPPTFIAKAIFGSGRTTMDEQGAEGGQEDNGNNPDDPDLDRLFPSSNLMQERLVSIRNRLPSST